MKHIAVIIATRGRPQKAGGVVECARDLLSGRHHVEFVVAHDGDDRASIDYFSSFAGIVPSVQPRPAGVGDCWNRAARAHPADIYLALPDDFWISAAAWDETLVQTLETGLAGQLGIVSWYDPMQPTIAALFGMTAAWVEANGFIFDARFPFWWGDSALVETALFASGQGMPGAEALRFASLPGNVNPRLRDMDLWWALFAATRHKRVETGRRIARQAGLPELDPYTVARLVVECEARDAAGLRNAPAVLASIERPKAPDAEYRAAKAAAEAYLAEHDSMLREFA